MSPGPLGFFTNSPEIDNGTLSRTRNTPRTIILDPIVIYLPPKGFQKRDSFYKKMALGASIYQELGLVGQIAEKFIKLPYRKGGKIEFKTGKLKGQGLVCTSFASIFGALWFKGNPKGQERMASQEVVVRSRINGEAGKAWKIVRKRRDGERPGDIIAEMDSKWEADASAKDRNAAATAEKDDGTRGIALSPGLVYSDKFGGVRANKYRLKLKDLVPRLNNTRLYAMVTYKKSEGANPRHVWFLMYAKNRGYWVRIEATGVFSGEGRGAGPGIYKFNASSNKNYYQAWDWGPANRDRDPDIDDWEYTK